MRARLHPTREEGQAAAEFALVLPLLVVILLAIVQFGIVFNNYVTLTDASRAGARKAAVSRFLGDNGASAKAAVLAAAPSLSGMAVSVTASPDWSTTGNTVSVTASYPYSIDILGFVVKTGTLTSTTKERLE